MSEFYSDAALASILDFVTNFCDLLEEDSRQEESFNLYEIASLIGRDDLQRVLGNWLDQLRGLRVYLDNSSRNALMGYWCANIMIRALHGKRAEVFDPLLQEYEARRLVRDVDIIRTNLNSCAETHAMLSGHFSSYLMTLDEICRVLVEYLEQRPEGHFRNALSDCVSNSAQLRLLLVNDSRHDRMDLNQAREIIDNAALTTDRVARTLERAMQHDVPVPPGVCQAVITLAGMLELSDSVTALEQARQATSASTHTVDVRCVSATEPRAKKSRHDRHVRFPENI